MYKFVTNYKTSCKLLECGLTVVKKEVHDDEIDTLNDIEQEELEIEICKNEPVLNFDGLEPDDNLWEPPEPKPQKQKRLSQIKAKLESLKEINIKTHPAQKTKRKSGKSGRSNRIKEDLVSKKRCAYHFLINSKSINPF